MSLAAKYSFFSSDNARGAYSYSRVMDDRRKMASRVSPNYAPEISRISVEDITGPRPDLSNIYWTHSGIQSLTDFPGCIGFFSRIAGYSSDLMYYCILDTESANITATGTSIPSQNVFPSMMMGADGNLYVITQSRRLLKIQQDGNVLDEMQEQLVTRFGGAAHEDNFFVFNEDNSRLYSVEYDDFSLKEIHDFNWREVSKIQEFPFGWTACNYSGYVRIYNQQFELTRQVRMSSYFSATSFVPDLEDDDIIWTLSGRENNVGINVSTGRMYTQQVWTRYDNRTWLALPWGDMLGGMDRQNISRTICYNIETGTTPIDFQYPEVYFNDCFSMMPDGKIFVTSARSQTRGFNYEIWDFSIGRVPNNLLKSEYAFATHYT